MIRFKFSQFPRVKLILVLLTLSLCCIPTNNQAAPLSLSETEKTWIEQQKKPVIVGAEMDWPPFDFVKDGKPTGYSNDLVRLAALKIGLPIKFVSGLTWAELVEKFKKGEIDVLPAVYKTPIREKEMSFTRYYAVNPSVLIGHEKKPEIRSIESLSGKNLAVVEGFATNILIKEKHPKIKQIQFKNMLEALKAVSLGKADAFVGNFGVISHILNENLIPNIRVVDEVSLGDPEATNLHMAVLKEQVVLRDIIQKGLDDITETELSALRTTWLGLGLIKKQSPKIKLTNEEKAWLKKHPEITLGFTSIIPPLVIESENGKHSGILVDIYDEVESLTGIKVNLELDAWVSTIQKVKDGKIDGLLAATKGLAESIGLISTQGMVPSTPTVFARNDAPFVINEIKDLEGKRVAVIKGAHLNDRVLEPHKDAIEVIETDSGLEMLKMVYEGKVDAAFGFNHQIFIIQSHMLFSVEPVLFAYQYMDDGVGAVRADWPEFVSIMNKGLNAMGIQRLNAINQKWIQVTEKKDLKVNLTKKEQNWIAAHPTIHVHNELNWPPFNYNKNGLPRGFSIDFMNVLANRIGVNIEYVQGEWEELLEMAFNKELDVMLNIVKTPEREKHLLYAGTYAKNPNVIVTRQGESISDVSDLSGKKVAYPRGFFYDALLKEKFPSINRNPLENTLSALKALQFNQVDAVLGEVAVVRFLMREHLLTGIEISGPFETGDPEIEKLNIAVRNDWPELQSILKKALSSISTSERNKLRDKWLGGVRNYAALNQEEQTWLMDNPRLRITVDPSWMPLERINPKTQKHEGVIADYLGLISERSGLEFEIVPASTWEKATEMVVTKQVDGFSGVKISAERETNRIFSNRYLILTDIIVTRQDADVITGLADLTQKRVGVVKFYWTEELLRDQYPEINLVTTSSTLDGLRKVTSGDLDAFVDDQNVMAYLINQYSLHSLKFAAPIENQSPLHIALIKETPPIVMSIINKAIGTLTADDKSKILQNWGTIRPKEILPGKSPAAQKQQVMAKDIQSVVTRKIIIQGVVFLFLILVLVLLLGFIINRYFNRAFVRLLESKRALWLGPIMAVLFLIAIIIMTQVALNVIEKQTRNNAAESLQTVVHSVHDGLMVWFENHKAAIKQLAQDPVLVALTKEHLEVPNEKEAIQQSASLVKLREYFGSHRGKYGDVGFFIINPQYINVGSMRDTNLGETNLIAGQRERLLKRAFSGETVFIPPVHSDVVIDPSSAPDLAQGTFKPATMFFAAPIRDQPGNVLAVLTLRFDPTRDFRRLIEVGRMGQSGETYAFDHKARFISQSRFPEQLESMGLIKEGQQEILNMKVSDPGGNLLAGFKPATTIQNLPLTQMAKSAIAGNSGVEVNGYRDYRGIRVLGAWLWDQNLGFGLATEIDEEDALSTYQTTKTIMIAVLGLTAVLSVFLTAVSLWLGRRANLILQKSRDELDRRVTERTAELKDSEEKFRGMTSSAQSAIIMIDNNGNVDFWNLAAEKIFGWAADEIIGKNLDRFVVPERYQTAYRIEIENFGKTGKSKILGQLFEIEAQRKNGDEFPIEIGITGVNIKDQPYCIAIINDITKRKMAEGDLRKLTRAVEDNPMAVIITDRDGTIEYVNPKFSGMSGYESDEAIGRNPRILGSDYHSQEFFAEMWHQILSGNEWHGEFLNKKKTGELVWQSAIIAPILDEKEEITHFVSIQEDVTEKKLAAEELQKLSRAIEASPVSVVVTDAKGTIEYVNPIFCKVTGYSQEEAIGQNPSILNYGEQSPDFYKEMWDTIAAGNTWTGEFANKKKNGEKYWESASISPVRDTHGEITHYVAVKEDITQSKLINEELREAKQQAEEATQAKSDFLANMSHEIRTPMNAILGLSHLALKTDLTSKQHDYIYKIDNSAKSLLGIINDILDFSKIEAGKMNMEVIDFDLNEVMSNLSNMISVKTQEKGLELVFDLHPEIPTMLKGDSLRLGQILLNLVNNAVKFTDKGEIVVSVNPMVIDEDQTMLKFSVRDTGIGLTQEQQGKLFQSFQQADTSTTRKFGGTGLGLTISKKFAEMMGGEIGVDSESDIGSTFYFTARFGRHEKIIAKHQVIPESLKEINVLVVDDNDTFCLVMRGYLEDFGFSVGVINSGNKAIQVIENGIQNKQKPFDLIIMDWQMPGLDGIETSKQIKAMPTLNQIPKIILATGYGREDVMKKADDLDLDGFLIKPINQSILFDAVLDVFGHESSHGAIRDRTASIIPEGFDAVRGAHILLVEDNEINQQVATELLEGEGFFVSIANNGQKALDRINESVDDKMFDVILMDLQMPVMDGYTATKKIRQDNGPRDLPIIAMTADAMSGVQERAVSVGMNDYVTKPIDPATLFKSLVKWIKPGKRTLPDGFKRGLEANAKDQETLPDLPGIDVENGIKRLGGSITKYKKILIRFVDNQENVTQELQSAVDAGHKEEAVRFAHTLKGLSGTIGANQLHQQAATLEDHLKKDENEAAKQALEDVHEILQTTIDILRPLMEQKQEKTTDSELNIERLKMNMTELKAFLEDDDTKAETVIDEIMKHMTGTKLEKIFKNIQNNISEIEYEDALEELEQIDIGELS